MFSPHLSSPPPSLAVLELSRESVFPMFPKKTVLCF